MARPAGKHCVSLRVLAANEPRNETRKISSDIWRVFFPGEHGHDNFHEVLMGTLVNASEAIIAIPR